MTLIIFLALLLIASGLAVLKWHRASRGAFVLAGVFFWAGGSGLVTNWLLAGLQSAYTATVPAKWGNRNVIVVLGAGTLKVPATDSVEAGTFAYARLFKTLVLYNACKKNSNDCKVIVSGGDARGNGITEAAFYGAYLRELGVQAPDLVLETRSMNTYQNAEFTGALLRQRPADRVLLVTSGFHLRRGLLYFAHFGVKAAGIRADFLPAVLSFLPIAYNFAAADLAIKEYIGIGRYHVYNFLGWNIRAERPGAL
jgi:uncharacterized SAM-binding protein YcdF (DUF218 family)